MRRAGIAWERALVALAAFLVFATVALMVLQYGARLKEETALVSWQQFLTQLKAGEVESVAVEGRSYSGTYVPGSGQRRFETEGPDIGADAKLRKLITDHAKLEIREPSRSSPRR
ncbi:MAG: ATP-dependent metallopeptidase FtsH/Yme1/Tma family protein [Planctomycetota bacterium]